MFIELLMEMSFFTKMGLVAIMAIIIGVLMMMRKRHTNNIESDDEF